MVLFCRSSHGLQAFSCQSVPQDLIGRQVLCLLQQRGVKLHSCLGGLRRPESEGDSSHGNQVAEMLLAQEPE